MTSFLRAAALVALVAVAGPWSTAARADDDDDDDNDKALVSDRPDFVESSQVVGTGRFQIETGPQFERNRDAGVKTRTLTTPTLLRYGIAEAWELRAETDGYVHRRSEDSSTGDVSRAHGFSDLSLGVKWHVQDGKESTATPSLAWLLHADLDSGSSEFRGNGVRPSLRFVAEWDLPNQWGVGVMPGVFTDRTDNGHHYAAGIFAVTVDKGWSDSFHTFVELAGQELTAKKNGGSVVSFDFGGAYLINDSLQVDLAFARGLNHRTPDFQWTVGLSARF